MSKVIYFSIPGHGHINPVLPLIKELTAKGETVIFYSFDSFKEKIENAGAQFQSYGDNIPFDLSNTNCVNLVNMLMESSMAIISGIIDRVKNEKPDYIMFDSLAVWGKYLSIILNIPAINFTITFVIKDKSLTPAFIFESLWQMITNLNGQMTYKRLAKEHQRKFGVKGFGLINTMTNWQPLNIVFNSQYLQPGGEHFDEDFVFIGPSFDSRKESVDFPFEKLANKTVVYISMGTVYNQSLSLFEKFITAFENTDKVVVISVGNENVITKLKNVPDNFIIKSYVPQLEILKRAKVFITHGGINSINEGLNYHVPLLIIPQIMEQRYNGKQIEKLGAGICLRNTSITPRKIWETVDAIINTPRFVDNAKRIADSFKSVGGVKLGVEKILTFKNKCKVS